MLCKCSISVFICFNLLISVILSFLINNIVYFAKLKTYTYNLNNPGKMKYKALAFILDFENRQIIKCTKIEVTRSCFGVGCSFLVQGCLTVPQSWTSFSSTLFCNMILKLM